MPALSGRVVTKRLVLTPVAMDDLPEFHRLHADPVVWTHYPSGRHTSLEQSRDLLERFAGDWASGLGYWTAHRRDTGEHVGVGGCRLRFGEDGEPIAWNVYYRVEPAQQGRGLATELARTGVDRAREHDPDAPITAFLLEHNLASKALAERIGLRLVWRGADAGNPDPDAIRLVYSDREPTPAQLAAVIG